MMPNLPAVCYLLPTVLVALPLVVFSLRRLLFTLTALMTPTITPPPPTEPAPDLLILVPCRNDGSSLPGLVDAILTNGYPTRPPARICSSTTAPTMTVLLSSTTLPPKTPR